MAKVATNIFLTAIADIVLLFIAFMESITPNFTECEGHTMIATVFKFAGIVFFVVRTFKIFLWLIKNFNNTYINNGKDN